MPEQGWQNARRWHSDRIGKRGSALHPFIGSAGSGLFPAMRAIRLCAIILLSFDCQLSNSQTNFSAQQSVPVATGGTIVGYSPAPGTQLRKEILDFIRPYCGRELHQSVIFKVFMLSVPGDRAMATLAPLQKNGRPIATVQRYLAVLSRANQTWRLET